MRVLSVVAVLSSLLALALHPSSVMSQLRPGSTFTEVQPSGSMWSSRGKGNVEYVVGSVTSFQAYNDGTGTVSRIPGSWAGYFLLYGGQVNGGRGVNDVWVGSPSGTNWYFVAGVTSDGIAHPTYGTTSFTPAVENGHCQDSAYRQYRAGGVYNGLSNEVWSTSNGYIWNVMTTNAEWSPRYFPNLVADPSNRLFLAGGILQQTGNPRDDSNEVWTSSNQGRTWTLKPSISSKQPLGRGVAILLNSGNVWGSDNNVLLWMTGVDTAHQNPQNGDDPLSYLADIWASQDQGANWNAVTLSATFGRRDDANAEVTQGGLLTLAGGYAGTGTREVFNDVWVSANGGYSWGQCVVDAEWEDRRYLMTVIDGSGVMWIMGGELAGSNYYNDIWKSTWSFNDNTAVAQRCKISIPSCGTGLRCQPGSSTTLVSTDGTNVYCSACPYNFGTTTAQTLVVGFLVFFLLAFFVAAGLLGYTYHKLRAAGAASPIPLPGAAQRWWDKSSASSVNGTTTDTAAGDTLYQPLRIRDQV